MVVLRPFRCVIGGPLRFWSFDHSSASSQNCARNRACRAAGNWEVFGNSTMSFVLFWISSALGARGVEVLQSNHQLGPRNLFLMIIVTRRKLC